jgi:hypothetical protein
MSEIDPPPSPLSLNIHKLLTDAEAGSQKPDASIDELHALRSWVYRLRHTARKHLPSAEQTEVLFRLDKIESHLIQRLDQYPAEYAWRIIADIALIETRLQDTLDIEGARNELERVKLRFDSPPFTKKKLRPWQDLIQSRLHVLEAELNQSEKLRKGSVPPLPRSQHPPSHAKPRGQKVGRQSL